MSVSNPRTRISFPRFPTRLAGTECADGTWFYGLHILSGRIKDLPGWPMKTALREIATAYREIFASPPLAELEHLRRNGRS